MARYHLVERHTDGPGLADQVVLLQDPLDLLNLKNIGRILYLFLD